METTTLNLKTTLECLEKLLLRLTSENISSPDELENFMSVLDKSLQDSLQEYSVSVSAFSDDGCDLGSDIRWRFIDALCFLLDHLSNELTEDILSLSNQCIIKEGVFWVVVLGIVPNLINGTRVIVKDMIVKPPTQDDNLSSLQKYRRLCTVTKLLVKCLHCTALRSAVLAFLGSILTALCQLGCAPLKKPGAEQSNNEISQELYEMFCRDQIFYQKLLTEVINSVYQPRVIRELMVIQGSQENRSQPLWLRKSCSKFLTQILLAPKGVSAIIGSTLETSVDIGADWKMVNILTKIITSPQHQFPNICAQLCELLINPNTSKSCISVSIACVNELLSKDSVLVQTAIVDKLLEPLRLCSIQMETSVQQQNVIVTEENFTLCLEHLHQYFTIKCSTSSPMCLPSHFLYPVSHILFCLYGSIKGTVSHVSSFVARLLFVLLSDCSLSTLSKIVKVLVFKEDSDSILNLGNISFVLGTNGGVRVEIIKEVERGVEYSAVEEAGDVLMHLLDKEDLDGTVSNNLFLVLLEILSNYGICPKNLESCDNVLGTVEDAICELVTRSERHVGAVRLLAALAENSNVQKKLSKNPECIVGFLEILLQREVHNAAENGANTFSDEADILCVALMILEVVISGNRYDVNWDSLKPLIPPLEKIKTTAVNPELQNLASHIYISLKTKGVVTTEKREEQCKKPTSTGGKSECDQAFEDSCDALLPIRGHALVKLTELINLRDQQAIAKKDAILCLFQENLKNADTFIYLAAINGMAALTNYFPDTVLSTLTEEFALAVTAVKCDSDGENLTRMKIGEVLLKVTRLLGEMVSKYKSQLLNVFLIGVKDIDPLVRASSLSNLGEVCRSLGFRIGPILQEILTCVRDVVNSDKALEPRRAAVMVLTLLLQGLQKDALEVLCDDILLLYRALKDLYQRETDHATKLHAQLALEEVDRIARSFLFSESRLTRKITMS